jgi:apolipoprotein N-acyltransferase
MVNGEIQMKRPYTSVASLLGMFFILSVAIGLDNWINNLHQVSQKEFSGALSWLVPANIAVLLLAGLLLVWLWFVYNKDQNIRVVAIIYTLAGFGLLYLTRSQIALFERVESAG